MSLPIITSQIDRGTGVCPAMPSSAGARVVFSQNENDGPSGLSFPARQAPPPICKPLKSILKKPKRVIEGPDLCSYRQLAVHERATAPTPTSTTEALASLLPPVLELSQSLSREIMDIDEFKKITNAYKTLHSSLCAAGSAVHGPEGLHNHNIILSPLREYQVPFIHAVMRDLLPAAETARDAAQCLPDEPHSNAKEIPKRLYETDAQAQWAREEHSASLAAVKLLEKVFDFDIKILSGELFREELLGQLISTLLSVTKTATPQGYGSVKVYMTAMSVLERLSALFQSTTSGSLDDIATSIIAPHVDALSFSLLQGILTFTDQGRRKGVMNGSLRAVIQFLTSNPTLFTPAFVKLLSTVLIQVFGYLDAEDIELAGNAIRCVAWASTQATHILAVPFQDDFKPTNSHTFPLNMPLSTLGEHVKSALDRISGLCQDLNVGSKRVERSKDPAEANCSLVWYLGTLAAIFILVDNWLSDLSQRDEPIVNERPEYRRTNPVDYMLSLADTASRIITPLCNDERVEIRSAASSTFRVLLWAILRRLEHTPNAGKPVQGDKQNRSLPMSRTPTPVAEFNNHIKPRDLWLRLEALTSRWTLKGAGHAVVCTMLYSTCGGADQASRLDSALDVLLAMANIARTAKLAVEILQYMLAAPGLPVGSDSKSLESWRLSRLLPHAMLNACLDKDMLLAAVSNEEEKKLESSWIAHITPLSAVEAERRWDSLFDIWSAVFFKEYFPTGRSETSLMSVIHVWPPLLHCCPMVPIDQICYLFAEIFNATPDSKAITGALAERQFQSKVTATLWGGVVQRFGKTAEIRAVASNVFDKVRLALPASGTHSAFKTTQELLWALMQTNSSILCTAMQHLGCVERKRLWKNAAEAANDEELKKALLEVVFQEPRLFELEDRDWNIWRGLLRRYTMGKGCSSSSPFQRHWDFMRKLPTGISIKESCQIHMSTLSCLEFPLPDGDNLAHLFARINDTMVAAYPEINSTTFAIFMRLTELLPLLPERMGRNITPALTLWISDPKNRLETHDYNRLVTPGYIYILSFVQTLPRTTQTVHTYGELLGSIKARMMEIPQAVVSFRKFWEHNYVEAFRALDTPAFVRDLLHCCDGGRFGGGGAKNPAAEFPDKGILQGQCPQDRESLARRKRRREDEVDEGTLIHSNVDTPTSQLGAHTEPTVSGVSRSKEDIEAGFDCPHVISSEPTGHDCPSRTQIATRSDLSDFYDRSGGSKRRRLVRPDLPIDNSQRRDDLSSQEKTRVNEYLSDTLFTSRHGDTNVLAQHLRSLLPGEWLSDKIINAYLSMIMKRSLKWNRLWDSVQPSGVDSTAQEGNTLWALPALPDHWRWRIYCFNTVFWENLQKKGYQDGRLGQWTRRMDIFDLDLLMIPCHINGNHWTCVAVNFPLKQVQYYDSCGSGGASVFKSIREYLSQEHTQKKSVAFDFEDWADVLLNGPRQENGEDCGVFICQTMENLSRGVPCPFEFSQKDAEFLRKSMILHIGDGRLPFLPM